MTGNPDKRMPAVLHEADIPVWLGEQPADPETVRDVLRPYEDGGAWEMRPAGRRPKAPGGGPAGPDQDNLF